MMPLHKIAARVMGWGAATLLSAFLTFILGSSALAFVFAGLVFFFGAITLDWAMTFKFVYDNTRELNEPD